MSEAKKTSRFIERKNFSKIKKTIAPPDLVEIQKDSFKAFLQADVDIERGEKRKPFGLEEVFQDIFPIKDFNGESVLEYVDYKLEEPRYSPRESIDRNTTYASALKARVRLVTYSGSEGDENPVINDAKQAEVYLCDIPLMTELGTFVINGVERVVVNQLHRSPGIFFEDTTAGKSIATNHIYSARIIPYRGSWLDFEYDAKNMLYVRIDKKRKISATVLLKALDLTEREIIAYYYKNDAVVKVEDGMYCLPLPSVETGELEGRTFAAPIYDKDGNILVQANETITKGLFRKIQRAKDAGKFEERIIVPSNALEEKFFASDLGQVDGAKPLVEFNTPVTLEKIALLEAEGITSFDVLRIDKVNTDTVVRDMLITDKAKSADEARIEIYKKLRPGEPANVESAYTLFINLFFNEKRYDLSKVGRVKINDSLGLSISEDITVLTRDDLLETIKKLERIRLGKDKVDDIDHLGHRRVKAAGEQLQNHIRIGLARMEKTIKERMSMSDPDNMNVQELLNVKPLSASIKEFFGGYQLSQFMDQTNPLSEVTHKRRLSALGPGGLNRDRAGFEVRDVHTSHYGRICPIETP
ncbi:MAG: DNA-directed RNA polymerase subunit beta, partial [Deferribacteraceae bacterium]|nr:DNA-directed RNA polymerase subunit beta [Deferribacteraceae bacterium]